jgi:hypothetical protein
MAAATGSIWTRENCGYHHRPPLAWLDLRGIAIRVHPYSVVAPASAKCRNSGLATGTAVVLAACHSRSAARCEQGVHEVAIQNLPMRFTLNPQGLFEADGPTCGINRLRQSLRLAGLHFDSGRGQVPKTHDVLLGIASTAPLGTSPQPKDYPNKGAWPWMSADCCVVSASQNTRRRSATTRSRYPQSDH